MCLQADTEISAENPKKNLWRLNFR